MCCSKKGFLLAWACVWFVTVDVVLGFVGLSDACMWVAVGRIVSSLSREEKSIRSVIVDGRTGADTSACVMEAGVSLVVDGDIGLLTAAETVEVGFAIRI